MSSSVENEKVKSTTLSSIDAIRNSISSYDKLVDKGIPWKAFEDAMELLEKYKNDYSENARNVVEEVTKLLLDTKDNYQESTRAVFEWSSLTSLLLKSFLRGHQNNAIVNILEEGTTAIEKAIQELHNASKSLNATIAKLKKLQVIVDSDFEEGSKFYKASLGALLGTALVSGLLGPFGIIPAAAASKTSLLARHSMIMLLKKFEEVKVQHDNLKNIIEKSLDDIESAKNTLNDDKKHMSRMKAQAKVTLIQIKEQFLVEEIKESAENLIVLCDKYVESHS